MSGVPVQEEKNFEYFLYLPPEVRIVVIDGMEPEDRCRFTRCSRLSNKEARSSKHFLNALHIDCSSVNRILTRFIYRQFNLQNQSITFGFVLTFKREASRKYISYQRLCGDTRELWTVELSSLTDLVQYAMQHFRNALKYYQNIIKELFIGGEEIDRSFDYGFDSLKNLASLRIQNNIDASQFLSKIQHSLKGFEYLGLRNIANCWQIYQVREHLNVPTLELNNEQVLRLSASRIHIHIGDLTVENILSFIESWQNGDRDNLKRFDWSLSGSTFNVQELFDTFEVVYSNAAWLIKTIKHHRIAEKSAQLYYRRTNVHRKLTFEID